MRDVFLVRNGSSLIPLGPEDQEMLEEFPQRKPLRAKVTQPRSVPHNGFFHVLIQEAFDIWPKSHKAKPRDWKHLRAWLLVEADHCRHEEVEIGDDVPPEAVNVIVRAMRQFHDEEDRFYWFFVNKGILHMYRPLTIRFAEVGEEDFRLISEKVFKIIYDVTGLDADERHAEFLKANPEYQKKTA